MKPSDLRILIISYTLPPSPGIGGRRWAKFARYLRDNGSFVALLSAQHTSAERSEWEKDIDSIPTFHFKSKYPEVLKKYPDNLVDKIKYRWLLRELKKEVKGNFYDRAARDKEAVITEAEKIIQQHKITHVIASGAPFHLLHHVVSMKQKFPDVIFVADVRDPWTSDPSVSSQSSLSPERRRHEQQLEKEVSSNYDMILTVAEPMSSHFRSLYPKGKVVTLPNGFDRNDMPLDSGVIPSGSLNEITMCLTGTLYNNIGPLLSSFIELLRKKGTIAEGRKVKLILAGEIPVQYREMLKSGTSAQLDIVLTGHIRLSEVDRIIRESDFGLLLLAPGYGFSFSTKFLEYLMRSKPVLVLGEQGLLSEFVTDNRIGYAISQEEMINKLPGVLRSMESKEVQGDFTSVQARFDLSELTWQLIENLIHLKSIR